MADFPFLSRFGLWQIGHSPVGIDVLSTRVIDEHSRRWHCVIAGIGSFCADANKIGIGVHVDDAGECCRVGLVQIDENDANGEHHQTKGSGTDTANDDGLHIRLEMMRRSTLRVQHRRPGTRVRCNLVIDSSLSGVEKQFGGAPHERIVIACRVSSGCGALPFVSRTAGELEVTEVVKVGAEDGWVLVGSVAVIVLAVEMECVVRVARVDVEVRELEMAIQRGDGALAAGWTKHSGMSHAVRAHGSDVHVLAVRFAGK